MKTILAKQAKVHSAYRVQRHQHGIIARSDLPWRSVQLIWHFPCSCRRSFLNSLTTTRMLHIRNVFHRHSKIINLLNNFYSNWVTEVFKVVYYDQPYLFFSHFESMIYKYVPCQILDHDFEEKSDFLNYEFSKRLPVITQLKNGRVQNRVGSKEDVTSSHQDI